MFDQLRRAIALVLGNRSLLGQVICSCFFRAFGHLFKFSLASLFFTVFVSTLVHLWCVDNALNKGEIEEC